MTSNAKDSLGIYALNIGSALSIAISLFTLWHLIMKMKLNATLKIVLSAIGIGNCIGMLVLWLSSFLLLIEGAVRVDICSIILTSMLSMLTTSNVMLTLMSVLRYWISLEMKHLRMLSKTKIFGSFLAAIFSICGMMGVRSYFLAQNAGPGFLLALCSLEFDDVPEKDGKFRRFYFQFFQVVIKLVGLFFDIQMLFFVRKQHQVAPISIENELIPWKSSANNAKDDIKIPIQASIIATSHLLLTFGILFIIYYLRNFWLALTALSICLNTQLPVLLMFSIKKHKEKVKLQIKAQPPHGLHLHENTEPLPSQNSDEILEPTSENYGVDEDQIEKQTQCLHELSAITLNKVHLTNVEERHKTCKNLPVID